MHDDDRTIQTRLGKAVSQTRVIEMAKLWQHAEMVLEYASETERRATVAVRAAQQRLAEAVEALGVATYADTDTVSGVTQERTIPLPRSVVLVEWRGRINRETFAARAIPYATPDAG